ncbi:Nn.00g117820.m01.CDS01 [Neocucurbitaria sp. VM-36]
MRVCKIGVEKDKISPRCQCTLRSRFIDRWVCIPRAGDELEEDRATVWYPYDICHCGKEFSQHTRRDYKIVCNWCKGDIAKHPSAMDVVQNHGGQDEEYDDTVDQADLDTVAATGMRGRWVANECFGRETLVRWNKQRSQLVQENESGNMA